MPDQSHQRQDLKGEFSQTQVAQAGRDVHQTQLTLVVDPRQSENILNNNLEPLAPCKRPLHFIGVIVFLVKMLLMWFLWGWRSKFQFPFGIIRQLIISAIEGNIVSNISQIQCKNDIKINEFIEKRNSLSIEEKINIEAKLDLCYQLIQKLASQELDKKEALSKFLERNNTRKEWFSIEIAPDKQKHFPELYKCQTRYLRKKSNVLEKQLKELILLIDSEETKQLKIDDLIAKIQKNIVKSKKTASIADLSNLNLFITFLKLLSNTVSINQFHYDELEKLKNPLFYFEHYWKINCIAKKSGSRYHSNPKCHIWRRLSLDYIMAETYNDGSTDDFWVSFLSQNDTDKEKPNWGKEQCTYCNPDKNQ